MKRFGNTAIFDNLCNAFLSCTHGILLARLMNVQFLVNSFLRLQNSKDNGKSAFFLDKKGCIFDADQTGGVLPWSSFDLNSQSQTQVERTCFVPKGFGGRL